MGTRAACCRWGLLVLVGWVGLAGPSGAERGDRRQKMTLESDRPCVVNYQTRTSECSGNVVVAQGTLKLMAERLELREAADGHQQITASGTEGRPASFRQKRDAVDEWVEGEARRIAYDGRSGVLRFEGVAKVRRLRGTEVAEEILGSNIVWDSQAEVFSVQGGASTAANPPGRVRVVITPRTTEDAPAAPAAPASPAGGDRR